MDDGATKFAHSFASSLEGIQTSFVGMATKATMAGAAFGMMAAKSTIGGMVGLGKAALDFSMTQGQLTTGFEAMAQAHSVATRKILGQQGILGAALDKANGQAAGLAMGMKVSDQTAASAVASMNRFGTELKAVGVDSAATAVKLEDGLGISIVELGNSLKQMKTEFHLSDKEMMASTKLMTGLGEAIGDMQGPLKNSTQYLEAMRNRAALAARGVKTIGSSDTLKSLTMASKHLYDLTGDAKGAQSAALKLEQAMSANLDGFQNMFAGTSSDLGPFLKNFSVISGDIQASFAAAAQGPDAFIMSMSDAVVKLKKNGGNVESFLTMFSGQMREVLGDSTDTFVSSLKNVTEAKLQTMKATELVGKDLGKVAKDVWRSSMTLEESYKMITGAGMAAFRQIGRKSAVQYVEDTRKAFAEFNAYASKEVANGGVMGQLISKMSEVSSLGAKAFLPKEWRGRAAVIGELYDTLSPTIDAVGKLATTAGSLVNPFTLAGTAIAGFMALVYTNKTDSNTWSDAVFAAFQDVTKKLEGWKQDILEWAANFKWTEFFQLIANGLSEALKGLTKIFNSIGTDTINTAAQGLTKETKGNRTFGAVGAQIFNSLKAAFSNQDWGGILKGLWDSFKGMRQRILEQVKGFIKETFGSTPDDVWKELGTSLGQKVPILLGAMVEFIKNDQETAKQMRAIMGEIAIGMIKAIPALYDGFREGVKSTTTGTILWDLFHPMDALTDARAWINDLAVTLLKGIAGVWLAVGAEWLKFGTWIKDELGKVWVVVKEEAEKIWHDMWANSTIPDMVSAGIDHIKDYFSDLVKFVTSNVVEPIKNAFGGVVDKIKGMFGGKADSPSAAVGEDMAKVEEHVTQYTTSAAKIVEKVLTEGVVNAITGGFETAFQNVMTGSKKFFKSEKEMFEAFGQNIEVIFRKMWTTILNDTDAAVAAMTASVGSSLQTLNQLKAALEVIKSQRSELDKLDRDKEGKLAKKDNEDIQDFIARSIHKPDWYYLDYQKQFSDGIATLTNAIAASKQSTGSGSGTVFKKFKEEGMTATPIPGMTPGAGIPFR